MAIKFEIIESVFVLHWNVPFYNVNPKLSHNKGIFWENGQKVIVIQILVKVNFNVKTKWIWQSLQKVTPPSINCFKNPIKY